MDISGGLEATGVYYDEHKYRKALPRFVYITENFPSTGADENLVTSVLQGCECSGDCSVNCSCIRGDVLKEGVPFAVCGDFCGCAPSCTNRSLSSKPDNGLQFPLEVFECGDERGFGVRSCGAIPSDKFVCPYVGEVIGEEEAHLREERRKQGDMNFIICAQEFSAENTGVPVLKSIVDPAHYGGIGRFINHSCSPNLSLHLVRIRSALPTVCLFSVRDIQPFEELTFDYGGGNQMEESDERNSVSRRRRRVPCLCGSSDCRRLLPYNYRLF